VHFYRIITEARRTRWLAKSSDLSPALEILLEHLPKGWSLLAIEAPQGTFHRSFANFPPR
jgi:hypothetical protein